MQCTDWQNNVGRTMVFRNREPFSLAAHLSFCPHCSARIPRLNADPIFMFPDTPRETTIPAQMLTDDRYRARSSRIDDTRKKRGTVFWVTIALAMMLAYPLSFGPACWISERTEDDGKVLSLVYNPVIQLFLLSRNHTIHELTLRYLNCGLRRYSIPQVSNHGAISWRYFSGRSYGNGIGGFDEEKSNCLFERPPTGGMGGFGGGGR